MGRRAGGTGDGRGLSLVEILFAVCLLAVVSLPLVHFMLSSKRGITISHQELVATNCATSVLKILKSLPYDEIPVGREAAWMPRDRWGRDGFELASERVPGWTGPCFDFGKLPPCPEGYARFLKIEEHELDGDLDCPARIKILRVQVRWRRARRGDARVGVCTCVASRR